MRRDVDKPATVAVVIGALRDDWGIEAESLGSSGVRFTVVADRGRPLRRRVMLDLLSDDATEWLVNRAANGAQNKDDAVALTAFRLAEAVWLVDDEGVSGTVVVRVQPTTNGYELVAVER